MMAILADVYVPPVVQFLGMLVLSHFVFPLVFMEAVTSAYIEQLFYRDVIPNRSMRLANTLRANGLAAAIGALASLGVEPFERILRFISQLIPNSFEIGFSLLAWSGVYAVPVLTETLFWNRRSGRTLWCRVLTANFVSGVCSCAMVVFVRWLREHLPRSLEWKLRRFNGDDSWYMNPISWACFAILILAWIWRLPSKNDPVVKNSEASLPQTADGVVGESK